VPPRLLKGSKLAETKIYRVYLGVWRNLGVQAGRKSTVNWHIPSWILNAKNPRVAAAYARGFIDAEGDVSIRRNCMRIPQVVHYDEVPACLTELKQILEKSGITCYLKHEADRWQIRISDRKSFLAYWFNISFAIPYKREKLLRMLRTVYKTDSVLRVFESLLAGKRSNQYLERKVISSSGNISILLHKLRKRGLVRRASVLSKGHAWNEWSPLGLLLEVR